MYCSRSWCWICLLPAFRGQLLALYACPASLRWQLMLIQSLRVTSAQMQMCMTTRYSYSCLMISSWSESQCSSLDNPLFCVALGLLHWISPSDSTHSCGASIDFVSPWLSWSEFLTPLLSLKFCSVLCQHEFRASLSLILVYRCLFLGLQSYCFSTCGVCLRDLPSDYVAGLECWCYRFCSFSILLIR